MFEKSISRLLAVPCLVLLLVLAGPAATASPSHGKSLAEAALGFGASERPASLAAARPDESFGQMPLYFVENRGQLDAHVAYYVLGGGTQVYFAADGVTFALVAPDAGESRGRDGRGEAFPDGSTATARVAPGGGPGAADDLARNASPLRSRTDSPRQRWAVKLDFVGANPHARPVGEDQTKAVVSYFRGPTDQWHAGLPTYARVVYRDLWPGIDLAYYGQAGRLKYDFVVHPGADPARICLRYRGAEGVSVNAAGQLEVTTPSGGFTDDAPVAWQEIGGQRAPVAVAFDLSTARTTGISPRTMSDRPSATLAPALERSASAGVGYQPPAIGQSQSFSFSLAAYDRSQPLVIDPVVLLYCGYIGGSSSDRGYGIAVDGAGNAYVTGTTYISDSFPVTVGPDLTRNGGGYYPWDDAFVAKVVELDEYIYLPLAVRDN